MWRIEICRDMRESKKKLMRKIGILLTILICFGCVQFDIRDSDSGIFETQPKGTEQNSDDIEESDSESVCDSKLLPMELAETITLFWKEMTGGFEGMSGARPKSASVLTYDNFIFDQLGATNGKLQYCIRWESDSPLTSLQRIDIEAAVERWGNIWFDKLVDYNCWPFSHVSVKVVGVAAASRDLVLWDDDEIPVYVDDYSEGAPQCPQACGRFFHRDGDYSDCPGGEAAHYDMSLWLTDGFRNIHGGDWGQRLRTSVVMDNLSADVNVEWLRAFGYSFGFNNFSNWSVWCPDVSAPSSIMNKGTATKTTRWDKHMLRYAWDRLQDHLL